MKLVVNMIMGSMMAGFSEGLGLAKGLDLDLNLLLQVLDLGAMSNPMFRSKGPLMINGDFSPAFPLKHAQKDMRLALQLASEQKIELPVAEAANSAFVKSLPVSGDDDFSAVYKNMSK
jgi:glyoxylate/succinic semialdehyde reductase